MSSNTGEGFKFLKEILQKSSIFSRLWSEREKVSGNQQKKEVLSKWSNKEGFLFNFDDNFFFDVGFH